MSGPLEGIRIVEMGGIGPGPFAAMMLADHGAEVIRVERPGMATLPGDALLRSRKTLTLDLKDPAQVKALRALAATADVLVEGFRPGTMERLGLGPDILRADNARLIYARMTGWGQTGPYAPFAGHDINYISLSGALHAIGPVERPVAPPALIGDFGGGGMLLAFAISSALLSARATGAGQVIDCSMTEGSGLLMSTFYSMLAQGAWVDRRGENLIDGGAHFYGVYDTADGKFVSLGAIEPQFYQLFLNTLGLADDPDFRAQLDKQLWPQLRERLAHIFRTRTRDEWCALMEHTDICFAPVLSMAEAPTHAQARARGAFTAVDGIVQPAPAPRYSDTPLPAPRAPRPVTLEELGIELETTA